MRHRLSCFFLLLMLPVVVLYAAEVKTRPAAVAGAFYPADATELGQMIDGFLAKAELPKDASGDIVAMIVPHAGYIYSGPTAAYVYRLLKEHPVDTVVLVGPWHKGLMDRGASVWTGGAWKTPLGEISVDTELAQKIASESASFQYPLEAHATEHSLEAQMPFLQRVLPNAKVVPILITDPAAENMNALAKAIEKHTKGRKVVVLTSTDMSHYHQESAAHRIDAHTIEFLKAQDGEGIARSHRNGSSELCGHAAVQTALAYAKLRGDSALEMLDYSTSADTAGPKDRVVGYGAAVLWAGKRAAPDAGAFLNTVQQKKLLELARRTVEAHVEGRSLPPIETEDAALKKKRAVFVTLARDGQLRGCIGRLFAEEPLIDAVRNMAVQSAVKDPRFPPVTPGELKDIHYEVSVLSPPMRVGDASEIVMGKHGVIVRQGQQGGVFLPKVAEHFDNNKEKFLDELCAQKARLPVSCWQDPATEIDVFTAQEFGE